MNYTQKKSTCKSKNPSLVNKSNNVINNTSKSLNNTSEITSVKESLLVNTELCCRISSTTSKEWENALPNYVKKFVRKHTAVYCMATDGTKKNEDDVLKKFATRLVCCNSKINDFIDNPKVKIKEVKHEKGKSRHISGTIKCSSPWICPSCSATISMTRGEQLKKVVECGREHGRGYGMAVLTIPHQPDDALLSSQNILMDIWRRLQTQTPFRNWKKVNKIRFSAKGYEIMASIKRGKADWHPHFNIIFDFDTLADMTKEEKIKYELKNAKFLWKMCNAIALKYHGIQLKEPFLEEVTKTHQGNNETFIKSHLQVKGGVSFNFDFVEEYATKFGLVEEATAGMYKQGKGSFHPFQILDMIRKEDETMTKKEKILLIQMFREYAKATKGKRFFVFGTKQIKYYQENYGLELEVLDDELEIQARESKGQDFYEPENKLWELFNPNSIHQANLLNQETAQDMENYIFQIINRRLIE